LVPLLEVEDIEVRHLGLIEHPAVVQVAAALNRRLTASPLDAEDDEPPPPFAPFVVAASLASTNKPTVIGPSQPNRRRSARVALPSMARISAFWLLLPCASLRFSARENARISCAMPAMFKHDTNPI